jgi:hypothetical protein
VLLTLSDLPEADSVHLAQEARPSEGSIDCVVKHYSACAIRRHLLRLCHMRCEAAIPGSCEGCELGVPLRHLACTDEA